MPQPNITTLQHPTQLNPLSVWRFLRTRGLGRLALPGSMQSESRERWERELNRHYYACGCDTGAKGVVLFTLATLARHAWQWHYGHSPALGRAVLVTFLAAIAGGLVGKFIGLAIAGRKLDLLKKEITDAWKVPPPRHEEPTIDCG